MVYKAEQSRIDRARAHAQTEAMDRAGFTGSKEEYAGLDSINSLVQQRLGWLATHPRPGESGGASQAAIHREKLRIRAELDTLRRPDY